MIRKIFGDMPILNSIMAIVILGITFILIDGLAAKSEAFYGNVIDKYYKAQKEATGVGSDVTTGNLVITTEFESEEFLIMVKTESGKIVTVKCKPELYYQKEIGERIDCKHYKGLFTGIVWSSHGVR